MALKFCQVCGATGIQPLGIVNGLSHFGEHLGVSYKAKHTPALIPDSAIPKNLPNKIKIIVTKGLIQEC